MAVRIVVSAERNGDEVPVEPEMEDLVRRAFLAALSAAGHAGGPSVASVLLTDDEGIAAIHAEYLGDDNPTDVISFGPEASGEAPPVIGGPEEAVFGDIVVSVERAEAQAKEYGHSHEQEIALLVIHGVLHILGYDDCSVEARDTMRAMEARAMSLLLPVKT